MLYGTLLCTIALPIFVSKLKCMVEFEINVYGVCVIKVTLYKCNNTKPV